jgi:hypothetical protein
MQAAKVYAALLRLYPLEFRQRYGEQMLQVFRDSCRGGDGLARLWLAALADLLVNAIAERSKQMLTRRWLLKVLNTSVAGGAFALSSFALAVAMILFTYFLLVPWDEGRIPEGTFAAAVNCFFESNWLLLPSFIVTLCLIIAITRVTRRHVYSAIRIYNLFSLLNVAVIVFGAVVTQGSKIVIGRIFPNPPVFEAGYGFNVDPAYGTAVVYCGLVIIGAIIAFFGRLAWRPPVLPLTRQRTPPTLA